MVSNTLFSSDRMDWETPQWLFDLLDDQYRFSLDACATKENAKCWHYYTQKDNGLKRKWEGSVWCNPPYGAREIAKWTARAVQQISYKRLARAVFLLPAATDTAWWNETVIGHAKEIRFVDGRVKFVGATGSPRFASVVVIYDHRSWPYTKVGQSISARGR